MYVGEQEDQLMERSGWERKREKGRKKFILTRSSILISIIKMALKH